MAECEHEFLNSEIEKKCINKLPERGDVDNGITFAVPVKDIVVKDNVMRRTRS
jgi:hypothetical protein